MDDLLELVVLSGDAVAVHPLAPGAQLSLGRSDDNDIRVNGGAVSRRHAIIRFGPPLEIEDLGSANGTYLSPASARADHGKTRNLDRISSKRVPLHVGDSVDIGGAVVLVRRVASLGKEGDDVVVRDAAMRHVYEQAARAAQGFLPILILGETGVGKDVLARAVHRASPRASKPFLALNCAALSPTLLEAELFGHEKGSFTGAAQSKPGLIEAADGGTVFLDEIGELPMAVQVKFLRVIEQKEVLRVGARVAKQVDVRFIAATNRDLEADSLSGVFRQDLYFRLNGISLLVPPLRERRSEIASLAQRFLAGALRQMGLTSGPSLSPAALGALEAYAWPGNVRELRNVIERAAVLVTSDQILPEHLPPKIASPAEPLPRRPEPSPERPARLDPEADRQRIIDALARCDGNQTRAAELLGVSRRTLINRIIEYNLPRPRKP